MSEPHKKLLLADCWGSLEQALLSEIEQEKATEPIKAIVVLVGSTLLAQHLELTIYPALNQKGLGINVRVLLFPQLVSALELTSPFPEFKPPAHPFLKWLLAKDLLKNLETGGYFEPVRETQGLLQCLLEEYKDLKDGLIIEEAWEEVKQILPPSDKNKNLFKLLESLDQRLGNYEDDWEKYLRAICRADRFPKVFQTSRFFLYGFYDFTAIQQQLVRAIAQNVQLTALMLKPEKENGFFAYAQRIFNFYTKELKLKPIFFETEYPSNDLSRWKRALSSGEKAQFQSDRSLSLIFTPGIDREVLEIAREIIRLVKQEGLKFDEIGVLIRDYSSYAHALQEVFELHQIPYFLAKGKSLLEFSISRTLLKLFRLPQEDYARRTVIALLSSQCLKNLGHRLSGLFDLVSREAFIVKGKDEWQNRLGKYLETLQASLKRPEQKENSEEEDEKQSALRKELIEKKIQAGKKLLEITRELILNLEQIRAETSWKKMTEQAQRLMEKYLNLDFDSEPELKERIQEIFEQIAKLDQTGIPADYESFFALLEKGLGEQSIEWGKFRQGRVCISELMLARGVRFKAVILPGITEGSFPLPLSEKTLFPDEDREQINKLLEKKHAHLSLKRQQTIEEQLLFFLACQQADQFLILTAPWLNLENNTEKPVSYILYSALELALPDSVEIDRVYELGKKEKIPWIRTISLSDFSPNQPERALDPEDWEELTLAKNKDKLNVFCHLLKEPKIVRVCQLIQERYLSSELGVFTGVLAGDEFYQKNWNRILPRAYSPNRLKSYFNCPFQYLTERVLEVRELEEPERKWGFEKIEQGALFHKILDQLFSRLPKPADLRDENKFSQTLKQILAQEGKQYLLEETLAPELIAELELAEAEAFLNYWREVLLPGAEFKEWKTELQIEEDSVELELENGEKVYLTGKIDRLARGDNAREVLDYKFGSAKNLQENTMNQFQLPIYLLAVLNISSGISPEKIKSRFLVLDTKGLQKPESLSVSGIMLEELKAKLREWIKKMREGIQYGFFPPSQKGKNEHSNCSYCAYPSLCFSLGQEKLKNTMLKNFKQFVEDEGNRFPLEKDQLKPSNELD